MSGFAWMCAACAPDGLKSSAGYALYPAGGLCDVGHHRVAGPIRYRPRALTAEDRAAPPIEIEIDAPITKTVVVDRVGQFGFDL